jgi:hypothetical protein
MPFPGSGMNTNKTYHNYYPAELPLLAFKEKDDIVPGQSKPSVKIDEEVSRERAIICRACGNVITIPDQMIEIEGKSCHKFVNPAAIVYHIICFKEAPGCVVAGEPTREFTWFPGYSWCIALCSICFTHLGWHYTAGDTGFFGLIQESITENFI